MYPPLISRLDFKKWFYDRYLALNPNYNFNSWVEEQKNAFFDFALDNLIALDQKKPLIWL